MATMNYKVLHQIILFISIVISGCSQPKRPRCAEFFEKYPLVLEGMKGKPDTAILIETLNKIILRDAYCLDAYLTRADLLAFKDSLFKAKNDYKKALFLDTGNVYASYQLGMAFEIEEKYDSAADYFQKAINNKTIGNAISDYPDKLKGLGSNKSRYDIESAELMFRQGVAFYYQQRLQRAYDNFNFCIQVNYKLDQVYLYRGSVYFQTKQKRKGCEDFLEAKKLGNKDADIYLRKYCN